MIQPKDVVVFPVSSGVQTFIQARMHQTFSMMFQAMENNTPGLPDQATTNFAMVVTAILAQAEALNRMMDVLVEPESVPTALVSVRVREEVRRRVREVFAPGGEA